MWSFADVLRDDGVGYGDYLEQLTYLLFLKLAGEYTKPPYNRKLPIPDDYNWESMLSKRGAELDSHYVKLLRELGKASGILGQICLKAAPVKQSVKTCLQQPICIQYYGFRPGYSMKKNPLKFEDLNDFIACYNPETDIKEKRHGRKTIQMGAGESFVMMRSLHAKKRISTSSG